MVQGWSYNNNWVELPENEPLVREQIEMTAGKAMEPFWPKEEHAPGFKYASLVEFNHLSLPLSDRAQGFAFKKQWFNCANFGQLCICLHLRAQVAQRL